MPYVEYKTAFCFIINPIINNLKQIATSLNGKYTPLSALETMDIHYTLIPRTIKRLKDLNKISMN